MSLFASFTREPVQFFLNMAVEAQVLFQSLQLALPVSVGCVLFVFFFVLVGVAL